MKRKKEIILYILCIVGLIVAVSCAIQNACAKPDLEWTSYRVRAGDTIWGIGMEYCPEGVDINEWIWQVREQNRGDALIYPGQTLRILEEVTERQPKKQTEDTT